MAGNEERPPGPALAFDEVSLVLGGARLLDRVRLRIAPGTLHCVIGPNGAGKTSLLRCLLGQMPHTGSVRQHWPTAPGVIGYVPQTLDFDRTLPIAVEDFLALIGQERPAFLGASRARRPELAAALAAVGLTAKRHTALGKLSGGELKRLLLAQALSPRPALLVLDEPMNHLDAAGIALATAVFADLRREGATILCCLHDLAQVRALADAVTCLNAGRVVFSGSPAAVLTPDNILKAFAEGAVP